MVSTKLKLVLDKAKNDYKHAKNINSEYMYSTGSYYIGFFNMLQLEMSKTPDNNSYNNYINNGALNTSVIFNLYVPPYQLDHLRYADYFSEDSKKFLSDACSAVLDDDFDINICNNFKILQTVLNKLIVDIMFVWKSNENEYYNDVQEFNNIVSIYNIIYIPMDNYMAFICKFYALIENKDEYIRIIIAWFKTKWCQYDFFHKCVLVNSEINDPVKLKVTEKTPVKKTPVKKTPAKKTQRRSIPESVKKLVAGRQLYTCANKIDSKLPGLENYKCTSWDSNKKGSFDESGYEIDHIIEYALSKDNSENNLQALCRSCHMVKTKRFNSKNPRTR
jgi:5-methylcytosine-specific restriction endonuclease McrA